MSNPKNVRSTSQRRMFGAVLSSFARWRSELKPVKLRPLRRRALSLIARFCQNWSNESVFHWTSAAECQRNQRRRVWHPTAAGPCSLGRTSVKWFSLLDRLCRILLRKNAANSLESYLFSSDDRKIRGSDLMTWPCIFKLGVSLSFRTVLHGD